MEGTEEQEVKGTEELEVTGTEELEVTGTEEREVTGTEERGGHAKAGTAAAMNATDTEFAGTRNHSVFLQTLGSFCWFSDQIPSRLSLWAPSSWSVQKNKWKRPSC